MNEKYIDATNFKILNWSEIVGKELTITYSEDSGIEVLAGLDKTNDQIYVLAVREVSG